MLKEEFILNVEFLKNLFVVTLTTLLCPLLLNVLLNLINKRNKVNEILCNQMLFDIYIPLEDLTSANLRWIEIFNKDSYTSQTDFIFRELNKFYTAALKDKKKELLFDPFTLKHLSFSNYQHRNIFCRFIKIWHYKCLCKDVRNQINSLKKKLGYPTIIGRNKLAKFWFLMWYISNLLLAFLPEDLKTLYIQWFILILWFVSICFTIKHLKYFFYEI